MEKSNTRKYIIWGSAAVLLGVVGYMLWKKYRKPKDEVKTDVIPGQTPVETQVQTPVQNSSSTPSGPTAAQTELATKYRTWANSTDALSQKWGKKSKYDLDATGSYNKFFLDSYNGGGKAEYEASLSSGVSNASNKQIFDKVRDSLYNNKSAVLVTEGGKNGRKITIPFSVKTDGSYLPWMIGYKLVLYSMEGASNEKPIYHIYSPDGKQSQAGYWNYSTSKIWSFRSTRISKIGTSVTDGSLANCLRTLVGKDIQWT